MHGLEFTVQGQKQLCTPTPMATMEVRHTPRWSIIAKQTLIYCPTQGYLDS